jgi:signal transduction histidine kinase
LLIILPCLKQFQFPYRISKPVIIIIGVTGALLLGLLDWWSGNEISFSIFYLIPISYVVWFAGRNSGIMLAVLCAIIWHIADIIIGQNYTSPAIPYWNAFVRLGFFLIVVFLIHTLRKFNEELGNKVNQRTAELTREINERKRAEEELKLNSEKLSRLAKRIQDVREEENAKTAREIHDELGQALTAIKIDLMWLAKKCSRNIKITESLVQVSNTVDDAIDSIHEISARLRPRLLDELGLIPAIEWQMKEFQSRTGIRCTANFPDQNLRMSILCSTSLFRIFQEAVTNVARHSGATALNVDVNLGSDELTMEIKDNGIGFNNRNIGGINSLGILGMKERARMLYGEVDVVSVPKSGTSVRVTIPLKKNAVKRA